MRLREKYQNEIVPELQKEFGWKNIMLVPRLEKVVLNVGFGHHVKEKEYMEMVSRGLVKISGQKAVFTLAKKSISAFKIREGMTIGAKVTLRGQRMYDFVEKLVNITFPRVRDFRGISDTMLDRAGNLTIGFKDQAAFPEMKVEDTDIPFGLEVCLATTATTKEDGLALFKALGFPFKKDTKKDSK